MNLDVQVKIDGDVLEQATFEKCQFDCKRREVTFKFVKGQWNYDITCGGFGNGYGFGMSCNENCKLRITDLAKCSEIKTEYGSYLVQNKF